MGKLPPLSAVAQLAVLALLSGRADARPPAGLDANGHLVQLAAPAASFSYAPIEHGVQVRVGGVTKNVIFYGPATVRVNTTLAGNFWRHPSIVVTGKPAAVAFKTRDGDGTLTLESKLLHIVIDKATGAITFKDAKGKVYTQENRAAPQTLKRIEVAGAPSYEAQNTFTLKPDEAIYGFGFVGEGEINRRNKELLLVQTNIGIIIPVMMSSERYGILWDTYSKMRFKDGPDGASLWAESAPGGVDYYFMAGATQDGVVAAYRGLTGAAPMYPKQAFGLFMSKERYETQARLLEVAQTFRKEQFPLDYIVQDWQYWGSDKDGSWSGMTWNRERFPDPKRLTKSLHGMNLKLMVSIWPSVGNDTALARELDQHGLRFEPLHWISKQARIYDAFSPEGRKIYFKHVKQGLLDAGVDALWMDGTEVEVGTAAHSAADNERDIKGLGANALGDFTRYLNPYSLMTTLGTYEGQRATSAQRVFTLTRSAWAGAQRTAAASWSGDTRASWKTLQEQINGGVNVTVTGTPYWTQDTAGFFVDDFPGGEKNASYRELYARWLQYAAFNPIMRIHGTSAEREPYIFRQSDPEMYKALRDAVDLRYRLLPYIYSLSWKVTHDGYTLMRPLAMDFPDDRAVHNINDAFQFGPSFLVHPVTRQMYRMPPPPAATIPATALRTPDGKPGLAGQYFEGRSFESPKGRTVDATIDFQWPGPPLADIPAGLASLENFSARWTGFIVAPEDGEYELGVEGDDGFRLLIDGKLAVEDWKNGGRRYAGTRVSLKQGQRVPVTLEYYQGLSDRNLRLAWRTPSQIANAAKDAGTPPDTTMRTYLPAGSDWYDFWTHERYAGGTTVSKDVPLDVFPLYVRAGAIVPMGPVVQYATEHPDAPYEIRIYPGADGKFTVYEDDNETYGYEKGRYATYELSWNDAARSLSVGARKGSYPGLVKTRKLNIVLAGPANASAIGPAGGARSITYTGRPVEVKF
jgi:alpha-D-xyloside xylohydrolase